VGETLAVDAADFCLVCVVVRRAERFSGDAAFGDGLKISFRGFDFDGAFFDESVTPIGLKKVLEGFLFGEVDCVFKFAAEEGFFFLRDLKNRVAAVALGEDDLRDIEEWVDAGDLMDFFADELDRLLLRDKGHGDTFGGSDFLALKLRASAFVEIVAVTSGLAPIVSAAAPVVTSTALIAVVRLIAVVASTALIAVIALIAVVALIASTALIAVIPSGPVIAAAWFVFAFAGVLKCLLRRIGFCAGPCGTECKV